MERDHAEALKALIKAVDEKAEHETRRLELDIPMAGLFEIAAQTGAMWALQLFLDWGFCTPDEVIAKLRQQQVQQGSHG